MHILHADNHELIRASLRQALASLDEDIHIVECDGLDEALDLAAAEHRLELAILGLRIPGMNGVDGVREFHSRHPDVRIVVLSGYYDMSEILAAYEAGASGFIPKSTRIGGIVNAIRLVLSGHRYVPDEVLMAVELRPFNEGANGAGDGHGPINYGTFQSLTRREHEVLELLIDGNSNKEIARALDVQEVTVKLHTGKLFRKLGVATRTQAVTMALTSGWSVREKALENGTGR